MADLARLRAQLPRSAQITQGLHVYSDPYPMEGGSYAVQQRLREVVGVERAQVLGSSSPTPISLTGMPELVGDRERDAALGACRRAW